MEQIHIEIRSLIDYDEEHPFFFLNLQSFISTYN